MSKQDKGVVTVLFFFSRAISETPACGVKRSIIINHEHAIRFVSGFDSARDEKKAFLRSSPGRPTPPAFQMSGRCATACFNPGTPPVTFKGPVEHPRNLGVVHQKMYRT